MLAQPSGGIAAAAGLLPAEAEAIRQALVQTKGRYAAAAKVLGISRSTLWRKLKRLGLK